MSNWEHLTLDELCNFEKGTTGLASAVAGEYPLVATGAERRSCDTFQFDTAAVCIPLVSSTGHGHASLNHVHYQEGKFALGTILVAVIPKDANVLNAQFLHLYLSRLKDIILVPLMTGAANVSLSVSKIKQVKIPVPSIAEQLKVVSLFNRMDNEQSELSDEISTQQELLKKLRQSILQEAIEGKLTAQWRQENPDVEPALKLLDKIRAEKDRLIKEKVIRREKNSYSPNIQDDFFQIPSSWATWILGDMISISSGDGLTAAQMINGEYPVFGGNGINGYHNQCNTFEETITIGRVGANCGAIHLTPEKAWITDNCFRTYYCKSAFNRNYLIWYLKYLDLGKLSFKGSQPVISGQRVYPLRTFFPPMEEQKIIVEKIENHFAMCDELEQQINESKTNTEMLMQVVLKEAFEK